MERSKSMQNPWAGLSSYEDPLKSSLNLKFCGRDNDIYDLVHLIDDNFFVTLYGKSGIGKTSLLNAGVFPALRKEQYTPVSLRLGMTDDSLTFQDIITNAIENEIAGLGGSIKSVNVVEEQHDRSATDYLWNYFARHIFLNRDGQVTFPVIVFDQFEEVFRQPASRAKAEILLAQLHYLIDENNALNDCIVDGEEYFYDFNFRFVVTVREDDLYRLEDSIDNHSLTSLKRCRYRLRALSKDAAREVILVPGEDYVNVSEQEKIVRTIINIASDRENNISTNLLSLICNRIFVDYLKSGNEYITSTIVETFVKGNPFERFYNEATKGLDEKEKSYIEDSLVDSTGRRNSVPESDFLLNIRNGQSLLEGDNRILQKVSVSSGAGGYRIELIHDSFCEPISKLKQKREQQKRRRQLTGAIAITLFVIISALGLYLIFKAKNDSIQENMKGMQAMRACYVALKVTTIHNPVKTLAMLLSVLPKDWNDDSRPYSPEAASALVNFLDTTSLESVISHKSDVICFEFSPDSTKLLTGTYDGAAFLWDVETDKMLMAFEGMDSRVRDMVFSSDGNKIFVGTEYSLYLYDTETGNKKFEQKRKDNYAIMSLSFIDNDTKILVQSVNEVVIIDIASEKEVFSKNVQSKSGYTQNVGTILINKDKQVLIWEGKDSEISVVDIVNGYKDNLLNSYNSAIGSVVLSPDGNMLLISLGDGTARVFNIYLNKETLVLKGHNNIVNCATFSHDGKYILTASDDNTARVWDAEYGKELLILKGHTGKVFNAEYCGDDSKILTESYGEIILWDARTGEILMKIGECGLDKHDFFRSGAEFINYNGSLVLESGQRSSIWDISTRQIINQFTADKAKIYKDKIYLVLYDGTLIKSSIVHRKSSVFLQELEERELYVYFGADILSNSGNKLIGRDRDHINRQFIWDVNTGTNLIRLNFGLTSSVCFAPDDSKILMSDFDSLICIMDAITGTVLQSISHENVNSAVYTPDGLKIVSTSRNDLYIWDAKDGKKLKSYEYPDNNYKVIKTSSDGYKALVKAGSHKTSVIDLNTGNVVLSLDYDQNDTHDYESLYFEVDMTSSLVFATTYYSIFCE